MSDVTLDPGAPAARPAASAAPAPARGALSPTPLVRRIAAGEVTVALSFAGQGVDVLEELVALVAGDPTTITAVQHAEDVLRGLAESPLGEASGRFRHGLDLVSWVTDPDAAPPASYRQDAAISYPLLLLAQRLVWDLVAREGLPDALAAGRVVAVAGHSQGLLPALMVAEAAGRPGDDAWRVDDALFERYVRYSWAQGLHMAAAAERPDEARGLAPLVAVGGVREGRLRPLLDAVNARVPAERQVAVALVNGPENVVVGGPQGTLALLRDELDAVGRVEAEARRRGARGGAPLRHTWTALPVDVPFHTPGLAAARDRFAAWLAAAGPAVALPDPSALGLPVLSPVNGRDLRDIGRARDGGDLGGGTVNGSNGSRNGVDPRGADALTAAVLDGQFVAPVRWDAVCGALESRGADWVLDLGPGTAVARLTGDALRGSGVHAVGLASPDGRRVLATPASAPAGPGVRYADLAPRVVALPDGRRHVDTRYTRSVGMPPIVLAGMTPTTTDAPIVAAAANAGYVAELAGGGQPDRFTLDRRLAELQELLEPGREVWFNTLLLDRHLWGLHVEREGLVVAARDAGVPVGGLTVSAGVPDVDEAIALLDRLAAHGMRTNAFKPGTVDQVHRALAIADAAPHQQVTVHIEGGQGGGHHSWEDLDELLLATYHELRRRDNVVVVAGGGVGTPERARELLLGTWSVRHGERPMPVDGVLVGTAAMAVREAAASPQVKRALVAAAGTPGWVPRTGVAGGVTSATSNLNADIHLLENAAARAGKLLQQVAGDEDAVRARRDEIVEALSRTAKPYVGDVEEMTYAALLERVVELLATGRGRRYDDGAWGHPTWRSRGLALFRRFAARLDEVEEGDVEPPVATPSDLDDPAAALAAFAARYPHAATTLVHPADRQFLLEVCDRPGKPIPFVPVLDGEVRRWYMADGLWQAQDDRLDADAVFVIPGPQAVAGITRDDEPVGDLLRRFEAATLDALEGGGVRPVARERLADPGPAPGVIARLIAGRTGPVAAFCAASSVAADRAHASEALGASGGSRDDGADASVVREGGTAGHAASWPAGPSRTATPNPLWTLLRDGDDVVAHEDDGRLAGLEVVPHHGAAGERLTVAETTDGGVELRIALPGVDERREDDAVPLVLRFAPLPVAGGFRAVDDASARAAFARRALVADDAPDDVPGRWRLDAARAAAYRSVTGAAHDGVPLDLVLGLAWPTVAATLSDDAGIAARLAELVHARHEVAVGPAWPPAAGASGTVAAEVVALEDPDDGPTRLHVRATLTAGHGATSSSTPASSEDPPSSSRHPGSSSAPGIATRPATAPAGAAVLATVDAWLVIAGAPAVTGDAIRRTTEHDLRIEVQGAPELEALAAQGWLRPEPGAEITVGDVLHVRATTGLRLERAGAAHRTAAGEVRRADGTPVARIALDETVGGPTIGPSSNGTTTDGSLVAVAPFGGAGGRPDGTHPVDRVLELLAAAGPARQARGRKVLARTDDVAPESLRAFARIGGDGNPLHRCVLAARMAGLDEPIVHGAWTAARAGAFVVDQVCGGDASALERWRMDFVAPVAPGALIDLEAARIAVRDGRRIVEVRVLVDGADVAIGEAVLRPTARRPRALLFPGQGIQRAGLGAEGRGRSAAARAVWKRADALCRDRLGLRLLDVVTDDPPAVRRPDGTVVRHPDGVLQRTEITQVALVALAAAQVAELRAEGVLPGRATDHGFVAAGHSVGEFSALHALGVLGLEQALLLVQARGEAMQRHVPRDGAGASPYRMAVVDPRAAGGDLALLQDTVAAVAAATGDPLEIVNHNARDRQYAVVGTVAAVDALGERLPARGGDGATTRSAVRVLPGIDVPFHSSVLAPATADLRTALEELVGPVDHRLLVGRWVPNLVARPFALDDDFVAEVARAAGEQRLPADVVRLEDEAAGDAPAVTRREAGNAAEGPRAGRDIEAARADARARALVVALLAAQLSSPVLWAQTMDVLLAPSSADGLGVVEAIEVAPPHATVLTGLARTALERRPDAAKVRHLELDRDVVFARDVDAALVEEPSPTPVSVPIPAASSFPIPASASSAIRSTPVGASSGATSSVVGPEGTAVPAVPVAAAPQGAPAAPGTDRPVDAGDALRLVLAVQARIRPDQVPDDETIDELFEGVSSRRNQVLIDLGREFALSGAEGAQQQTIGELTRTLRAQGERYRFPGPYLQGTVATGISRVLGRAAVSRADAQQHLERAWGLGPGLVDQVLARVALDTREGPSARGEALARLDGAAPTTPVAARELLDRAVGLTAADLGLSLARAEASAPGDAPAAGPSVVAQHVEAAMLDAARTLAEGLGRPFTHGDEPLTADDPAAERLAVLDAEQGVGRAELLAQAFDPQRHVRLSSAWASARWDLVTAFHAALDERLTGDALTAELDRIALHGADPAIADTARWLAGRARAQGNASLGDALAGVAEARRAPLVLRPGRPTVEVRADGPPVLGSVVDPARPLDLLGEASGDGTAGAPEPTFPAETRRPASSSRVRVADPALQSALDARLRAALTEAPDLTGEVALVTGASPGSIAAELVRNLLRGGATVVATTSALTRERRGFYRALHREAAAPGAELHVLPANLASFADIDALLAWLGRPTTVQRRRPDLDLPPLWPTIVAPFAAVSTEGDLTAAGADAEAAVRVQLLGVERLVAGVARGADPARPATVLLPLSPNHGAFGDDGPYGETKAALEVLLRRRQSELDAWGKGAAIVAPRIGWVRGTGLMGAASAASALVEERLGLRTFEPAELGWLLTAMVAGPLPEAARRAPVVVDATGGFDQVDDLRAALDPLVDELRVATADEARRVRLTRALRPAAADAKAPTVKALPSPGTDSAPRPATTTPSPLDPADLVVIVGTGELGPAGTGRTRFAMERDGALPPSAVGELAWLCGLVRFDLDRYRGRWTDVRTGEEVAEEDLRARYADEVAERSGVRVLEDDGTIDPAGLDVLAPIAVDREVTFTVDDEATARTFAAADPDGASITRTPDGSFRVRLRPGTQVRVARTQPHRRRVGGQFPRGLDLTRWGVPDDLIASTDRMALINLACTSEAFAAAGLEPEELLANLHPTQVANTQGAGLGGMASLRRLLLDHLLDGERQPDRIQESLGNVVAAHVVQAYVGSYGPMVHPVAACATAAVSLEEAHDKIRAGKAQAVLAGGFDDLTPEGLIGFGDMGATASSDELDALGVDPAEASRPGDLRRRGFVEAQGGGALLVVRGDVALRLGLPVRGVLAFAGSYADGVQSSIPAPGMGLLGAATGGPDSPLAHALARHGLSIDDVGVVSKHDTATEMNDPLEADLHQRIQTALGRTAGNPLLVISQKSVTGHSKGGAAAWQVDGVLRAMESGVVPGNHHLESVDPLLRETAHLAFGDREIVLARDEPLRAAVVASLGFGHVGALVALAHPDVFLGAVPEDERDEYLTRAGLRRARGAVRHLETRLGRPPVVRRGERRIDVAAGETERDAEARALLDPATRFRDGALRGEGPGTGSSTAPPTAPHDPSTWPAAPDEA